MAVRDCAPRAFRRPCLGSLALLFERRGRGGLGRGIGSRGGSWVQEGVRGVRNQTQERSTQHLLVHNFCVPPSLRRVILHPPVKSQGGGTAGEGGHSVGGGQECGGGGRGEEASTLLLGAFTTGSARGGRGVGVFACGECGGGQKLSGGRHRPNQEI